MEDKEASIKDIIREAEEADKNKDNTTPIRLYKEEHGQLYIQAYGSP